MDGYTEDTVGTDMMRTGSVFSGTVLSYPQVSAGSVVTFCFVLIKNCL